MLSDVVTMKEPMETGDIYNGSTPQLTRHLLILKHLRLGHRILSRKIQAHKYTSFIKVLRNYSLDNQTFQILIDRTNMLSDMMTI